MQENEADAEIVCPLCQAPLVDSYAMLIHSRLHHNIRPFQCHRCNEAFASFAGLLLHRQQHRRQQRYSCSRCQRQFQDVAQYAKHSRKHQCLWKRARLHMLAFTFWRNTA